MTKKCPLCGEHRLKTEFAGDFCTDCAERYDLLGQYYCLE